MVGHRGGIAYAEVVMEVSRGEAYTVSDFVREGKGNGKGKGVGYLRKYCVLWTRGNCRLAGKPPELFRLA